MPEREIPGLRNEDVAEGVRDYVYAAYYGKSAKIVAEKQDGIWTVTYKTDDE